MADKIELQNAVGDAITALNGIVGETEKFANQNILDRDGGGWSDNCGQSISRMLISSVQQAVDKDLHLMFNYEESLKRALDDMTSIISTMSEAYKELG